MQPHFFGSSKYNGAFTNTFHNYAGHISIHQKKYSVFENSNYRYKKKSNSGHHVPGSCKSSIAPAPGASPRSVTNPRVAAMLPLLKMDGISKFP